MRHAAITTTTTREQHREPLRPVGGLAGQQDGRGDRAGARHQRDRQREGRDVVDVLLDAPPRRPWRRARLRTPEHHLEGDREQQQPAGDAEGGQRDAELPQQPVADQRRADQDRAGDQAGAQRDLRRERGSTGRR